MTQYVTIVLAVENMANFDVEFKSEIHGGKVVGMAKYDALAVADKACVALKVCADDGIIDYSVLDEINENKRGNQWLATGRCDKCDDELIALGIQADKDKIKELERLLKDCADELSLNIAYCKNAPTIKNRAWQLHDKIRNELSED